MRLRMLLHNPISHSLAIVPTVMADAPWWAVTLLGGGIILIGLVKALLPTDSGHLLRLWLRFLDGFTPPRSAPQTEGRLNNPDWRLLIAGAVAIALLGLIDCV